MATTIQVSPELVQELKNRKMLDNESYEEIIWDLIEDAMELSGETKREIEQSEKEYKAGKFRAFEDIKKDLGLDR